MNEPEIGPFTGETTCAVGEEGTKERCGKPGKFHLLLQIREEGAVVDSVCAECFDEIMQLADSVPVAHSVGPNCGMPGTSWSLVGCFVV